MDALALHVVTALLLAAPAVAHAHGADGGVALAVPPWVAACLAASAVVYATGVRRVWRHAGAGRGVSRRQVAAFAGGWVVLAAALASPLDALGGRLFWVHMVQHELLMVVAAPLLVLGRPLAAWTWALPPAARRAVGGALRRRAWRAAWARLTGPLGACLVHAAALWAWHRPAWFDAALAHDGWHAAQHASFLAGALLFWWSLLGPTSRAACGAALVSLFATVLHTSALGALLALSPDAWYAAYVESAPLLGWDALEDQQLGGLVMWVPAGLSYLAAGVAIAARWIGLGSEARAWAAR